MNLPFDLAGVFKKVKKPEIKKGNKGGSAPSHVERIYLLISDSDSDGVTENQYVCIVDGMEPAKVEEEDIPERSKVYLLSPLDAAVTLSKDKIKKKKNELALLVGNASYTALHKKGKDGLNRFYVTYNELAKSNKRNFKFIPIHVLLDSLSGGVKKRKERTKIGLYVGGELNRVFISIIDRDSNFSKFANKSAFDKESAGEEVGQYELPSGDIDFGSFDTVLITQDELFKVAGHRQELSYSAGDILFGVPLFYVGAGSVAISVIFFLSLSAYEALMVSRLGDIKAEIDDIKNVQIQKVEGEKREIYKSHMAQYIASVSIDFNEVLDTAEHVWSMGTLVSLNAEKSTKRITVRLPSLDESIQDPDRKTKIKAMIDKKPVNGYSKQPLSSDASVSNIEVIYVKETFE